MAEATESARIPDKSTVSRGVWFILLTACAVSVLLELTVHRHVHFKGHPSWLANASNAFGFYVALGFIACSGCVLIAKLLGFFLKASEDYYDDDAE